jgi:hypothetical protein
LRLHLQARKLQTKRFAKQAKTATNQSSPFASSKATNKKIQQASEDRYKLAETVSYLVAATNSRTSNACYKFKSKH